jgi:succinate dehydrogenase / fumarate reductase, membrane anchor subunit
MSQPATSQRTPLARARGLGSAREGTDHFWRLRVTAVANLVLVCVVGWLAIKLAGADHATVKRALAKPQNAIALLALVLSGVVHMRLGMQTIIEDYVHSEGRKVALLVLNSLFAILIGLTSAFAVLKLALGA